MVNTRSQVRSFIPVFMSGMDKRDRSSGKKVNVAYLKSFLETKLMSKTMETLSVLITTQSKDRSINASQT